MHSRSIQRQCNSSAAPFWVRSIPTLFSNSARLWIKPNSLLAETRSTIHFDFPPISSGFHFHVTLISFRLRSDITVTHIVFTVHFISISLRAHFDFTRGKDNTSPQKNRADSANRKGTWKGTPHIRDRAPPGNHTAHPRTKGHDFQSGFNTSAAMKKYLPRAGKICTSVVDSFLRRFSNLEVDKQCFHESFLFQKPSSNKIALVCASYMLLARSLQNRCIIIERTHRCKQKQNIARMKFTRTCIS